MEKKISIVRKRYYNNLKKYTENIFCHHHHSGTAQRQGGVISVGVSNTMDNFLQYTCTVIVLLILPCQGHCRCRHGFLKLHNYGAEKDKEVMFCGCVLQNGKVSESMLWIILY